MAEEEFEITPEMIAQEGAGPIRVTGDEGTVQKRKIDELIKADQYAAAKKARGAPFGMTIAKLNFPSGR